MTAERSAKTTAVTIMSMTVEDPITAEAATPAAATEA
jgi:hypothetical protein